MSEGVRARIERLFEDRKLRCTPQRYALIQFLAGSSEHPTADRIFDALNSVDPHASRATIYNNLRTLVEAGLVREIALEGRAARFDVNLTKHHHFVCEQCGNIEDVAWFDVPQVGRHAAGRRTVRTYELLLRGLCGPCQESHFEPIGETRP